MRINILLTPCSVLKTLWVELDVPDLHLDALLRYKVKLSPIDHCDRDREVLSCERKVFVKVVLDQ